MSLKLKNMKLKHSIETKISVDCDDLQDFIEEEYGSPYEIVAFEEWDNDSSHQFMVRRGEISMHNHPSIFSLKNGDPVHYSLHNILQDLVNRYIIIEGNYIINVSW